MPSIEYMEEILNQVKQQLPKWAYISLMQIARGKAGGRIRAQRAKEKFEETQKAKWTAAFINDLPDSSFLYIVPGGSKDEDGKTVPRSGRYLPYRDMDGNIDLPHLRNALARMDQVDAPGIDKDKIREKAQNLLERAKEEQANKALISFVVSDMSPVEKARDELIVGEAGRVFERMYLDPLGIDRDDIHVTLDKAEIEDVNPCVVIALGKDAKTDLGDMADFYLPHPTRYLKRADNGEVERKLKSVHKVLFDRIEKGVYFNNSRRRQRTEPIVEYKADPRRLVIPIHKSAPVKRIVYGVVSDPYGSSGAEFDAHNDWISPAEVEKMAHDYMKKSRVVGLQHRQKASAQVVESWIEQYPTREEYLKAINGEAHRVTRRRFGDDVIHSGSWVMGVELSEKEWDLFEKGELNAFSIGAHGTRAPISKQQMPEVTFVDLAEGAPNA